MLIQDETQKGIPPENYTDKLHMRRKTLSQQKDTQRYRDIWRNKKKEKYKGRFTKAHNTQIHKKTDGEREMQRDIESTGNPL